MSDRWEYRKQRIEGLWIHTVSQVTELNFPPHQGEKAWDRCSKELDALVDLIKMTHNGTRGFEERDLPEYEKETLEKIRHNVKILGALYGPSASS